MPLDYIQADRGDFDSLRSILGVTKLDVTDAKVQESPHGPAAERDMAATLTARGQSAATLEAAAATQLAIRLAAQYLTAAYIADGFARGGFVGLMRPSDQARKWDDEAARYRAYYEREMHKLAVIGTDTPEYPTDYGPAMQVVGGPSRTADATPSVPWYESLP